MPRPDFSNYTNQIEEIVRVNHAGEYGAQIIYQGQLKFVPNSEDRILINSMLQHEEVHLAYFKQELLNRTIRPTFLLPLWHVGGYILGAVSALAGIKTAMLVTQAVEEVIEGHYKAQLASLKDIEEEVLFDSIKGFMEDEIDHKNIALLNKSQQAFLAPLISMVVKKICKAAIKVSKVI